jgi:prefoldin subunit 5
MNIDERLDGLTKQRHQIAEEIGNIQKKISDLQKRASDLNVDFLKATGAIEALEEMKGNGNAGKTKRAG